MSEIRPTSIRLHPAALALLDELARYESERRSRNVTRAQIIEGLLDGLAPSLPGNPAVRDAFQSYKATR
jgi:hypothetical protein